MRIVALIFLFLSSVSFAQEQSDGLICINGYTLSKVAHDTIPLSIIEVRSDTNLISSTKSDFNGMFTLNFCSREVSADSVQIKIYGLNHFEFITYLPVESKTKLDFLLVPDSSKSVNMEFLNMKSYYLFEQCGTEDYNRYRDENPLFTHCDGRRKRFKEIMNEQGNLIGWRLYNPE